MLENILGPKYVTMAREGYMVDLRLRQKLDSIVPQGDDVESYLFGLVWRLAGDDQQKACTIAQNMGIYDHFLSRGHFHRPRNAGSGLNGSKGNPGLPSGNGGGEKKTANAPQNAFDIRQSQFGLVRQLPADEIITPPNPDIQFKIDPTSKVSQSVLQIDSNFSANLLN